MTKKKIDLWPDDWLKYGIDWDEVNRRGVFPKEAAGMVQAFQDMLNIYNKECDTHIIIQDFYWTNNSQVSGAYREIIINVTDVFQGADPIMKFKFGCQAAFYNMQNKLDYAAAHFRLLRAYIEGKTYVLCKHEVPIDETEKMSLIMPDIWIPEGYELKKKEL